jgi:hypothetical protein
VEGLQISFRVTVDEFGGRGARRIFGRFRKEVTMDSFVISLLRITDCEVLLYVIFYLPIIYFIIG